jgi:glycerate kinase
LGAVLQAAARKGARRCLVGIGGSATNDGGFGIGRALGWKFLNAQGAEIRQWFDLQNLAVVRAPEHPLHFGQLIVAVDVQNPLLGARGATRVFGPQKGLRAKDFPKAERALGRLAFVLAGTLGRDLKRQPGTGAAGGLGFGLAAFLGARLEPGFELFSRQARLQSRVDRADVVITGEGTIDRSTLMGKGVGQIAALCRRTGRLCLALAGQLPPGTAWRRTFTQAYALTGLTSEKNAKAHAAFWLERAASGAARNLSIRA